MKPTRLLPCLIALVIHAATAPAQTAIWRGQNPPDPARTSQWTDGANWNTGIVPNGPSAVAQLDQAYYGPGLIARDQLQILNADITLDSIQYAVFSPPYSYPQLPFPSITVGGSAPGDRGSLEFTGRGIPALEWPGLYANANFTLRNGALRFLNQSQIGMLTTIDARDGANQIWFGDDSRARTATITVGDDSRLDLSGLSRFENGTINSLGAHVGFAGNSTLLYSGLFIYGPGLTLFSDQANSSSSYFYFQRPAGSVDAILNFSGRSTVQYGSATSFTASGIVEFTDQADTYQFNLNGVRQLDITGASTGTGTTGRLRATVNTPAPVSVAADDARTVSLGYVNVFDLLLGSNSVRVNGGQLRYISDVGGAYVSADGSNLAGGGIIQSGASTLVLHPSLSVYAVPLTIERGLVYNYRQTLGPVVIGSNGQLLPFTGNFASVVNHGRYQHGFNDARILGNFTQSSSGVLALPGIFGGPLEIGGTASLDGRLEVTYGSGYFVGSRRHLVLRANAVTGRFAQAPEARLSPMLSTGVEYDGNEVYYVQRQHPFALAGAVPTQQDLGAHLDHILGQASGSTLNLLFALNSNQNPALIAAGLGQLAPDRYGALNEQGFITAAARQAGLDHRLAAWRASTGPGRLITYAEGIQQENEFAALDGLPEARFTSRGGSAGAAWRNDRWMAGVAASRQTGRGTLDPWGSTARVESTTPELFVRHDRGAFFIHGSAARSSDRHRLVRNSGLLNRHSIVAARTRGSRTDLALTAGATLGSKAWRFTPYAGVLASRMRLDDFTESTTAGQAGTELAVRDWSVDSLRTRAGFDLARPFANRVTPRLSVTWLHELEKDRALTAGLAATGAFYRAPGRAAETDLVQASLGVDWLITRRLGFSVNAGLARGRNTDTTSDFSAGLRWEF
jgi:uncharacterized protein YhjY with autotransporter beta-barrel domain